VSPVSLPLVGRVDRRAQRDETGGASSDPHLTSNEATSCPTLTRFARLSLPTRGREGAEGTRPSAQTYVKRPVSGCTASAFLSTAMERRAGTTSSALSTDRQARAKSGGDSFSRMVWLNISNSAFQKPRGL
jgi:hypothetical protein